MKLENVFEHTPGPWIEGIEGNPSVYGPDGMGEHSGLIAEVFKGRGNVRLIAAAPEMLDALRLVRMSFAWQYLSDQGKAAINAAIAKAAA